jgi:hypothetical protein
LLPYHVNPKYSKETCAASTCAALWKCWTLLIDLIFLCSVFATLIHAFAFSDKKKKDGKSNEGIYHIGHLFKIKYFFNYFQNVGLYLFSKELYKLNGAWGQI